MPARPQARQPANELDPTRLGAARNVACALVVLVHANLFARPDLDVWWPGGVWFVPAFSLAVPLFFTVSGYFALSRPPGTSRLDLGRRLNRLLPPFLFWNLVNLGLLFLEGDARGWRDPVNLLTGSFQLYFVFVLMQFEIVAAAVQRFVPVRHLDRLLLVAATLTGTGYALAGLALYVGENYAAADPWLRRPFVIWSLFFALGVWLRWRPAAWERMRAPPLAVALALVPAWALYCAELGLEGRLFGQHPDQQFLPGGLPLQVIGVLALMAWMRRGPASDHRILRMLACGSRHTFTIYLGHVAALIVLYDLWWRLEFPVASWPIVPALAIGAWAVPRLLGQVGRHLPSALSRCVTGVASRRRGRGPQGPARMAGHTL